MLKIGITQRVDFIENYNEKRDSLDQRWTSFCKALHALIVPLANTVDPAYYCDALGLNGIIFSGGNATTERDAFEKKLLHHALERKIPLCGVCKGMQFIANFFGSTLIEIDGHIAQPHVITVVDNKFGLKPGKREVNSFHRYGIKDLPQHFKGIAYDEHDRYEAMYHDTLPLFCCMWHPEREDPFSIEIISLLKQLFMSC